MRCSPVSTTATTISPCRSRRSPNRSAATATSNRRTWRRPGSAKPNCSRPSALRPRNATRRSKILSEPGDEADGGLPQGRYSTARLAFRDALTAARRRRRRRRLKGRRDVNGGAVGLDDLLDRKRLLEIRDRHGFPQTLAPSA